MLQIGNAAPNFALPNQNGSIIHLSEFRRKKVVLYFYLKDDSPNCIKEACSFRDSYQQFIDKNAVILGISCDNKDSHRQFIEKFNLPFHLLSDVDTRVAVAYSAYGEKLLYGRKFMGIHRTTFIIDEQGKINYIFKNVKPAHHAKEVLEKL